MDAALLALGGSSKHTTHISQATLGRQRFALARARIWGESLKSAGGAQEHDAVRRDKLKSPENRTQRLISQHQR